MNVFIFMPSGFQDLLLHFLFFIYLLFWSVSLGVMLGDVMGGILVSSVVKAASQCSVRTSGMAYSKSGI